MKSRSKSPVEKQVSQWRMHLGVMGILLALMAIFYASFITGEGFLWEDQLYMSYPMVGHLVATLASGHFPLWLSGLHDGIPFYSDLGVQTFYLPAWLLVFFVEQGRLSSVVCQWYYLLHLVLAGVFSYAFLKANKLTVWAAVCGMIVFVFSAFLSLHFTQTAVFMTLIWLPAELYFVNRIVGGAGRWGSYYGLIVCLCLSFLTTFPQVLMYNSYLLAAYWMFSYWVRKIQESRLSVWLVIRNSVVEVLKIGGVFVVVILLGAVQFIPAVENWSYSARQQFGFAQIADESLPWYYLLHGFVPNFFGMSGGAGGVVPFWGFNKETQAYVNWHSGAWQYWEFGYYAGQLALMTVVVFAFNFKRLWTARRKQMFFFCALLPIFWLMLGRYGGLFNVFYHVVPGFSLFRTPARIGCLLDFCLAVTVAVFVDVLLERKVTLNFRRPLIFLAGLYGFLLIGFLMAGESIFLELKNPVYWTHAMKQLAVSITLFIVIAGLLAIVVKAGGVKTRLLGVAGLGLATFIDLYLTFHHFHTGTVNPEQYFADRNNLIAQMADMRARTEPFRFAQLRNGAISEEIVLPRNTAYLYPSLEVLEGYLLFNLRDHSEFNSITNQQARLAIQNVRVVANVDQKTGRVGVMVTTNSLPRAKFYHHIRAYDDAKRLYGDLGSGRLDYWRQIGISRDDARLYGISLAEPSSDAKAEVRFIAKTPEEYQISYNTTAPGIIFISESFYPGWVADNGKRPIVKTFGAFKGIVISEPGQGLITVRFAPQVFYVGLAISLSALVVLIIVAGFVFWRSRKEQNNK